MLSSHVELIGRHLHPTGQPFDGYAMRQAKRWHAFVPVMNSSSLGREHSENSKGEKS